MANNVDQETPRESHIQRCKTSCPPIRPLCLPVYQPAPLVGPSPSILDRTGSWRPLARLLRKRSALAKAGQYSVHFNFGLRIGTDDCGRFMKQACSSGRPASMRCVLILLGRRASFLLFRNVMDVLTNQVDLWLASTDIPPTKAAGQMGQVERTNATGQRDLQNSRALPSSDFLLENFQCISDRR